MPYFKAILEPLSDQLSGRYHWLFFLIEKCSILNSNPIVSVSRNAQVTFILI